MIPTIITYGEESEGVWFVYCSSGLCDPLVCDTEQEAASEAAAMADDVEDETGERPVIRRE